MRYIGMPFLRAQIMHAVYWYIAGIFRKLEVYWYIGIPDPQNEVYWYGIEIWTANMRYIGIFGHISKK